MGEPGKLAADRPATKRYYRGTVIAPPLLEAIRECVRAGQQALLLLNRAGYIVGQYVSVEQQIERTRRAWIEKKAAEPA